MSMTDLHDDDEQFGGPHLIEVLQQARGLVQARTIQH